MARPNILLITSDQQHHSTLGSVNPRIQTPALDRLAREGTRFDRAYCPNPLCSPSRSSIITGQYPSQHGCWTIGVRLPDEVTTIGQLLGAAGYRTELIGKGHFQPTAATPESPSLEAHPRLRDLDFWREFHGPWYGFQHIELARGHADEHLVGQHYAIWLEEQGLDTWRDYFRSWPPEPDEPRRRHRWELPEEYHYTRWTAERTIHRLERHAAAGEPFLLWASFHDPHPPYLVPEPWASMYEPVAMEPGSLTPGEHDRNPPHFQLTQAEEPDFSAYHETFGAHGLRSHLHDREALCRDMAVYYGMISLLDREIGRILAALDALQLADDTLVVFTTDHGHLMGQHGLVAKGPFHYEDLLRLPFIVRFPGRVPAGETSGSLQSLVDLAPTLLTAAGVEVPGGMQGLNQLPAWQGETDGVRGHVLVENRFEPTKVQLRTYIDARYKLTVYRDAPYGELFDLQEDPGEVANLWSEPGARELKARLMHRFLQAGLQREPLKMPRVGYA